jgi:hypothetical protein
MENTISQRVGVEQILSWQNLLFSIIYALCRKIIQVSIFWVANHCFKKYFTQTGNSTLSHPYLIMSNKRNQMHSKLM